MRGPVIPAIYAMVDCNNFYASCERVFNPALEGKPVVVLSNNDGCVIARSNEAKALGIGMAEPAYKREPFFRAHGVAVFSSNYALYGDMSARVHQVLSDFTPQIEHYSIDECFLLLQGHRRAALLELAETMRRRVKQWTGIPVCVGLAPTKTLAKVANRLAKKRPASGGVLLLNDPAQIKTELMQLDLEDVWGIGRRSGNKLHTLGLRSAWDLTQRPHDWVREKLTVTGLRTVMELQGIPVIELEDAPPPAQSITCSRSFGTRISDPALLEEALCAYVSRAAEKLRRRHLEAGTIQAYLATNRFVEEPQYSNIGTIPLARPSAFTPELQANAKVALRKIYRKGYRYKKVGVLLLDLVKKGGRQLTFEDYVDRDASARRTNLMETLDALNTRFGRGTLRYAGSGAGRRIWHMRREKLSGNYTTSWDGLPLAGAGRVYSGPVLK